MNSGASILAGTGCSLIDYLFTGIDFTSTAFQRYASVEPGDGGLRPGELVFVEGLESFAHRSYHEVLTDITGGRGPASSNLGGPSVVALVHAAQLLRGGYGPVRYFGVRGNDAAGAEIDTIISKTPLDRTFYHVQTGSTPFTHVLSDPHWDNGAGERSFINSTGVAGKYGAADIDDLFFDHQIVAFGGTALVPQLHAELLRPLKRAHSGGSLTVVNTVYDFFNQSRNPDAPWPLGESEETYSHVDLLIMDAEEARRLSGRNSPEKSAALFLDAGVSAVIITRGPEDLIAVSRGGRFLPLEGQPFPVSRRVSDELKAGAGRNGDTTGCGDNFVGGVLYSLAEQITAGEKTVDLRHALAWGVASGGFACFSLGGTFIESHPGEKREKIVGYVRDYQRQLGGVTDDA
jgi:sugar/nucleoside kinase (ribokinase family)